MSKPILKRINQFKVGDLIYLNNISSKSRCPSFDFDAGEFHDTVFDLCNKVVTFHRMLGHSTGPGSSHCAYVKYKDLIFFIRESDIDWDITNQLNNLDVSDEVGEMLNI